MLVIFVLWLLLCVGGWFRWLLLLCMRAVVLVFVLFVVIVEMVWGFFGGWLGGC